MSPSTVLVSAAVDWTAQSPASAVLLVQAAAADGQEVRAEHLEVSGADVEPPGAPGSHGGRVLRIHAQPGPVRLRYEATVHLTASSATVPLEDAGRALPGLDAIDLGLLHWTLPSRFCPADLLVPVATEVFGSQELSPRVLDDVRDWVQRSITYTAGVSNEHTTAEQTLLARAGVCRDFAHLTITLLRALGVPARMVAAYALDLEPPDFHALVEAHDGRRWRLLDATGLAPLETLVRIATGRDAAEIAWATTAGGLTLDDLAVAVRRT